MGPTVEAMMLQLLRNQLAIMKAFFERSMEDAEIEMKATEEFINSLHLAIMKREEGEPIL